MRFLLLIVAVTFPAPILAAPNPTERARAEAQQFLGRCPVGDDNHQQLCLAQQIAFVWDYVSAKSGDYEDQKNVSILLYRGLPVDGLTGPRGPAIAENIGEACAWQMVMAASGNPNYTAIHLDFSRVVCRSLSPDGQQLALVRARRLRQEIKTSPSKQLQGEAEDGYAMGLDGVKMTEKTYPLGNGPAPRSSYKQKHKVPSAQP